ncbi:MAG TPA: tyrosine--tRNA ligase [Hyphomonadaceae bacterium]|nr:tyrosine--tRNA ligase [Hyphomonadaceae bacterium]HPN05584.1 tyrosine--tRNA ligase [Hyphomonadaceae bacterium]
MTVLKIPPQSQFLQQMDSRGHIYQVTDDQGLDTYAASGQRVAYIGFDATAPSLHVGHMVSIMALRRFQQAGGKPIVLIGGGTTKIGDPTDKEKSRPILTEAEIASNAAGIKAAFRPFLKFGDGPSDAIMVDNAEWLDTIKYIEFLRDYGKHFTINKMIAQETVRRRLDNEEPYTFLEFNYMLLQAYDFLELSRRFDCKLQMGGSDQWGNIVNGIELTRRIAEKQVFGLTTPLITTASGVKMGKTVGGAVWLNAEMRSPYDYWQFWRNTEDADVVRFMKLFTDLPASEIEEHAKAEGAAINDAKKRLADVATTMLHGEEEAKKAAAAAEAVFTGGGTSEGMPTFEVPRAEIVAGYALLDALVTAKLAASKGEAKRAVGEKSVKLNGETVSDVAAVIGEAALDAEGSARLSVGKKRHARLKAV